MTEKNFWNCSGDELLKEFKTDSRGLSTERAEEIRSEKEKMFSRKARERAHYRCSSASFVTCW